MNRADPIRAPSAVAGSRRLYLGLAASEADYARRRPVADGRSLAEVHRGEQILLLARLAADTGARRGELAALQLDDPDGDVLTISRGTSNEMVGPTKSGRVRRLTLGATTARLWRLSVATWRERAELDRRVTRPHVSSGAHDIQRRDMVGQAERDRCAQRDLPDPAPAVPAVRRLKWRPPEWCATGPVTGETSCRAATA